ncbi:MAG: hypothetical protein IJS15_01975, partial [Victivallales bacterium]|nr:hypothetical protein [Victivallales bacterium]
MAWAENNYIETRFVKGMNCSVEPHTLDRDTGELPDIMNMVCRTQGLRTRKGWLRVDDLSTQFSVLPTNAPSGLFLFEPVLPEEPSEEGEEGGGEGGESGGTPAINPSDLIGGGGSIGGGGGGIKPKPTEEEEEVAPLPNDSWTLAASAATVMPYVPFDLTITRVSGTASEPRWLQGSLLPTSYKGSYSGDTGSLKHTSTNVWTRKDVMVRNLNRSITNVKYKAGPSSSVHADCQVAYALYSFVPNLPSGVVTGTRFDYTVTCVNGGGTVTGYRGGGRGVVLSWKFYDANNNRVSGTASSPNGTWRNGVYYGTCVVRDTDATRVVLEVEFLGETSTASANIVQAKPLLSISVTEQLHIYGGAGVLSIEVTDEYSGSLRPSIQMNAYNSSDVGVRFSDWFEDENGNLIDMTQGWTHSGNVWSWSGTIRAKSSRRAETITLSATYKNSDAAMATIEVLDGLSGELDAPSVALNGVAFSLSASVASDSNEEVPRLETANLVLRRVSGSPSLSSSITTYWELGEPSWEAVYSCTLTGTGNAVIGLYYGDVLLTTCEIATMTALAALVEAINERLEGKRNLSEYNYGSVFSTSDTPARLREGLIQCVVDDDSYYGYFVKSQNWGPPPYVRWKEEDVPSLPSDSSEYDEWFVSAYNFVKQLKYWYIKTNTRWGNLHFAQKKQSGSGSASLTYDSDTDDSNRDTRINEARRAAQGNFSWGSEMETEDGTAGARAYNGSDATNGDRSSSARMGTYRTKWKLRAESHVPGVSCTIGFYGAPGQYSGYTFSKFGENMPDRDVNGKMPGEYTQSANSSPSWSGWIGGSIVPNFS